MRKVAGRLQAALLATTLALGGLVVTAPAHAVADTAPTVSTSTTKLISKPATTPIKKPATTPTPATVSADALPTVQIDGVVWAQVVVGNTVYAAGSFKTARPAGSAAGVHTVTRNNLLAYDITTGNLVTAFAPNLNGQALALAVSPDQRRLYVGGDFTTADGQPRSRIAAYDLTTRALVTTFKPVVTKTVRTIAVTNSVVYFGGDFTSIGTVARKYVAATSTSGALLNWNPTADASVTAMTLTVDGSKLVVGGRFQHIAGGAWIGMAALSPHTGATVPWAASSVVKNSGTQSDITSLTATSDGVYGTGYVYTGGRGNLEGAFRTDPATGTIIWIEDCHGDTYSLYAGNPDLVYVASHEHYCGNIGGFPQTPRPWATYRSTAFTKAATGTITADPLGYFNWAGKPSPTLLNWFPTFTIGSYTGQGQASWSVTGNSRYVIYGGEFTQVNGVKQQGLVRFAIRALAPNKIAPDSNDQLTPTVVQLTPGAVRVSWLTTFDRDSAALTYKVYRNFQSLADTPIYTTTVSNTFWQRTTIGFVDKTAVAGKNYNYRVYVTDPDGNTVSRAATAITVQPDSSLGDQTYPNAVYTDRPSLFWRLGEASTTAAYDYIGFDDGVKSAGVTRSADGIVPGDANTGSGFSGAADGLLTTLTAAPAPDTFSTEAWIRTTTTKGGQIIGYGNDATALSSSHDRQTYLDDAGHIRFGANSGGVKTVASADVYNDGNWHHVVSTLGPYGMALFVDGIEVGSRTDITGGQVSKGYWRVGGDNLAGWPGAPTSNYLLGTIDDVAIYPMVLTPTQVNTHLASSGRRPAVPLAPVAAFTPTVAGLTVGFDGTTSHDADGTVASYSWNWGDGTATGSSATATHGYGTAGTYTVTLTVTDDSGLTNSLSRVVTVTGINQPPTAAFTVTSNDLSAAFDASASTDPDGTVVGYSWDFGDNTAAATGLTTTHDYAAAGTYPVALTVTDSNGATATVSQTVSVAVAPPNQPPVAAFTSSSTNQIGYVDGTGSSDPDGTVTAYSWDFGDGSPPGTGATANHVYAATGTYPVTLTVTDNSGATSSITQPLTITVPTGPVPFAQDVFGRTTAAGLGTADLGGAWTVAGAASVYSTNGSAARLVMTAASSQPAASLASVSSSDTDARVDVSLDKLADGSGAYVTLIGRRISSTSDYRAYLKINAAGQVTLNIAKRVSGTETVLTTRVIPGLTYTPGLVLTVRFQVSGTSTTTLSAEVWPTGTAEPTAFQSTTTDSTADLGVAGGVGVIAYLTGSATNAPVTATFDNLVAQPVS